MNLSRENLLAITCIILTIGFILSIIGSNQEIKEYKIAYKECVDNINRFNQGYTDVWNRDLLNVSFNETSGYWIGELK